MAAVKTPYEAQENLEQLIVGNWDARVRLFKSNHNVNKLSTFTDFVQADFTGYNPANPTWSPSDLDSDNRAFSISSILLWTAPPAVSQTLYGWYITDALNTLFYAAANFDEPIDFSPGSPNLTFRIYHTLRQEGGWP